MAPLRTLWLAAALAAAACATPKQSLEDLETPEVLVEVLPRAAVLEVNGRTLGAGSRPVPVPEGSARLAFRASAPGFEPIEVTLPAEQLAGARLGLVLRPTGFGQARPLDMDDPGGLAAAAALLLKGGRWREAVEYAQRSVELAPDLPLPHRVLGGAYARAGDRRRSIAEYSQYLSLAPEAPDARAVERAIEEARGDLTIPER